MKKIFETGGSGYIGSVVVKRLVDDVLITGAEQFLRELFPSCLKP